MALATTGWIYAGSNSRKDRHFSKRTTGPPGLARIVPFAPQGRNGEDYMSQAVNEAQPASPLRRQNMGTSDALRFAEFQRHPVAFTNGFID